MSHPSDSLSAALQHQREGRLDQAEQVYRDILEHQPDSIDALNLLGALVFQQGRLPEAIACFEQVLTLQPDSPDSYNSLGVVLKGQGRVAEAADYYRRALALRPDHPEVLNNLGNVLRQLGELAEAIVAYEKALTLKPNYPEAHNNLGAALKDAGRLEEAITHYREALVLKPTYAEAHHNLGATLQRQGRLEEAAASYQQALALKPNYPEVCNSLGNLLQQQGCLDAAIARHQQAIALRAEFPEAHHSLANALLQQKQVETAIAHYQQAIRLRPNYPEAFNNLGNALQEQGKSEEAIVQYRRAIELRLDFAEAYSNLGSALKDQRRLQEAIVHLKRAVELKPDYAEVHNNLGNALQEQGDLETAIACYRRALEIKPDFSEIHSNLGNMLQQLGQFEEAFQHFQQAIAAQPNYSGSYNNLGIALRNSGRFDEALQAYEKAVELQPDFVEAHWNIALHYLLMGDLEPGFAGYEWRFKWHRFINHTPPRNYPQPRWDGSPLGGKTIFLYAEQGLGDTIQFVRYAAIVAQLGGRIILECQPPLVDLLQTLSSLAQVIPQGSLLPTFDVHAPLMSLPHILGTRLDTIPAQIPYLPLASPPSPLAASSTRIGIAWTGNPENSYNRTRTIPLELLLELVELPNVTCFSLQKDVPPADQALLQAHPEITDLREQMTSFRQTAELISELDLVITVDTAIAHLAGALGKPVWLLLPISPDWRWMLDRDDSPWYPTMRLFRQTTYGDWQSVLDEVKAAIEGKSQNSEGKGQKARSKRQKAKGKEQKAKDKSDNLSSLLPALPEALKTAIRLHQAGRIQEAEQLCRQLLTQQEHPEAWHLLGLMAHQQKQYEPAIAHYQKVLSLNPSHHDTCNNLAVALHEQGRLDEAIAYYQRALALKPDYADAHNNYANALRAKGRLDDAVYHYRMAVSHRPDYADAHNNLGLVLYEKGEFQQAADCYRQAVTVRPNFPQAHNHLGNALKELGDFQQAVQCYEQAIAYKPDYAKAYNNWGNVYRDDGNLPAAIQHYERAIAIEPQFAEAHWNKALTLLIGGDLRQGFAEYEWRWQVKLPSFQAMRSFAGDLWDGSPLNGKTILLHAEQGMGDILQFVRYIPLVQELGGRVILECHKPLLNLMGCLPDVVDVIPYGSTPPAFDVHAPLMSLAHILGTTIDTIPAQVPYLPLPSADAQVPAASPSPILHSPSTLHIGIVWSGNPENPYNRSRAVPLAQLLTLAEIPGVRLFSLQKDLSPADADLLQSHPEVVDLRQQLTDFVHTACLITQLDLVISVDTAVTHLAGALGNPVWLLLPFAPDWRWMLERDDSPWYPTMQLFRQPKHGDWESVLAQVRQRLEEKAKGKRQKVKSKKQKAKKSPSLPLPPYSPPAPLLATALHHFNNGNLAEVERVCGQILTSQPAQVEALNLLGVVYCQTSRLDEATKLFQRVVRLQPDFADGWCNLGSLLRQRGDSAEAIAHYQRAIELNPNLTDAHYNLALVLQEQDRLEEALHHCQRAIDTQPEMVDAVYTRGYVLRRLGRLQAAIDSYQRAIQLSPNYPEAHKNLGHALLLKGDLLNGFAEYEWRWRQTGWSPRPFSQPLWDGAPLEGRTILLHAEQGMGDTLQFIRYAALVKQRGGRVLVECQSPLVRLLEGMPTIDQVISQDSSLPPFDLHAPLLSLPHILRTSLDTIPAQIPYLSLLASPSPTHHPPSTIRIGLVWAGNPDHKNNRLRSCQLSHLQPLFDLPGVSFFSLQKGAAAAELRSLPHLPIHDLADQLQDFADTAAAIAPLDLVITVDTAVAHLAGALGKPVWLLLHFSPDWRWMLEGETTPWYPTMRLFRQTRLGDWASVVERMKAALTEWVNERNRGDGEDAEASPTRHPLPSTLHSSVITWQPDLVTSSGILGFNLWMQLTKHDRTVPQLLIPPDVTTSPALYQALVNQLLKGENDDLKSPNQQLLTLIGNGFEAKSKVVQQSEGSVVGIFCSNHATLSHIEIDECRRVDRLITSSTWNAEILRRYDLEPVQVSLQAIDPTLFYPGQKAGLFGDRFIIFSAGGFSYSGGQDILLTAFKTFQRLHPEALLLTVWHFPDSRSLPGFAGVDLPRDLSQLNDWLQNRGLPPHSVVNLGAIPYPELGQVLREADVAVFPDRCEAGSDPVAIASLACGIPTILSANTGHLDLLRHNLGYPLQVQSPAKGSDPAIDLTGWGESDVEELIETLEYIYTQRQEAQYRGMVAADFVQTWTWKKLLEQLL